VDNDRLLAIAAKNHLWFIEDCAQAQGAKYKDKTVGSMGHFGAFSFFPVEEPHGARDGGCITTNNDDMAERLRMLRNHGRRTNTCTSSPATTYASTKSTVRLAA